MDSSRFQKMVGNWKSEVADICGNPWNMLRVSTALRASQ
jgi:hypothetical protein